MVRLAEHAGDLGFTKSDLHEPRVKLWEHRDLCQQILRFKGNPVWEVVVYAVK